MKVASFEDKDVSMLDSERCERMDVCERPECLRYETGIVHGPTAFKDQICVAHVSRE